MISLCRITFYPCIDEVILQERGAGQEESFVTEEYMKELKSLSERLLRLREEKMHFLDMLENLEVMRPRKLTFEDGDC